MDERKRKIRHGLILQGCVEKALRTTKYKTFNTTPTYDEDSITPDFLIPDDKNPKFFIEVTQTENRASFKMKILRYFESVSEAKVHFGPNVISVNILMGDPARELPASNIRALYSFFDTNICPRNDFDDDSEKLSLDRLEADALKLAGDDEITSVKDALVLLLKGHANSIEILGKLIESKLDCAEVKANLIPLWSSEKRRHDALSDLELPLAEVISYKRPLLESLFITNEQFDELKSSRLLFEVPMSLLRQLAGKGLLKFNRVDNKSLRNLFLVTDKDLNTASKITNANKLPEDVKNKLVKSGLVDISHGISFGEQKIERANYISPLKTVLFSRTELKLKNGLSELITDPFGDELRGRCRIVLEQNPAIQLFFADIREESRRLHMAEHFWQLLTKRAAAIEQSFLDNLQNNNYAGIEHRRCWIADLVALYPNVSHNEMNRQLIAIGCDPQNLGNPYNQIAYKSERFMSDASSHLAYAKGVLICFKKTLDKSSDVANSVKELANRLLRLRLDGVIKLQNFNPLYLLIASICEEENLTYSYGSINGVLSDLASDVNALGQFKLFKIDTPNGLILVNALYVDEYGGVDKAKEWSARARSFPYRMTRGEITNSEIKKMIFIADGPWKSEAIKKLRTAGWEVCRPGEFQEVLRKACKHE